MDLADIDAPVIAYARDGFMIRPYMHYPMALDPSAMGRVPNEKLLRFSATGRDVYFRADCNMKRPGDIVANPDLARTLELIAVAAPRLSVTGNAIDVSNRIPRYVTAELKREGYRVARSYQGFAFAALHAALNQDARLSAGASRATACGYAGEAADRQLPPGSQAATGMTYWLGTDEQGRDMLSAILYGLRISLLVGFSSAVAAAAIGTTLGLVAAYAGGRTDSAIMRLVDLQLSFPAILVAQMILAFLGKGVGNVILALVICAERARSPQCGLIRRYIRAGEQAERKVKPDPGRAPFQRSFSVPGIDGREDPGPEKATPMDVASRHLTTAARLVPTVSDVISTEPEICASAGMRTMAPPAEISLMMQLYGTPDSVTSLAISTMRSRTNFLCLEDMSRRYHGGADMA